MSFENTQLTIAKNFNPNNLIFAKSKEGTLPDSSIKFQRIPIGIKNPDGTTGELVILTPKVYSFGLSENTVFGDKTKKKDGYTFPLCLQSRDGLTDDEKDFIDTFKAILEACKEHVIKPETKKELKKPNLQPPAFNLLYYKTIDGEVAPGTGPIMYPKIMIKKAKKDTPEQITTIFTDENGQDVDPLTLLNKHCYTRAAIKIESIFIGSLVSLQVKVQEAEVKVIGNTVKRLLLRPQAESGVSMMSDERTTSSSRPALLSPPVYVQQTMKTIQDDDDEPVDNSDDEDDEPVKKPEPTPAPKAPVRRVAAKK